MADGNDTEMAGMKQKQQGHGRSFSVEDIKGPSKTIMILVYVLLAYSVIISTVALIMVIMAEGNSGGSSESCDCTVNSLAAKTELSDNNGLGDSGFCEIIDYCMDTTETSVKPTGDPSMKPTEVPSKNPSTTTPSNIPSYNPSTTPSNMPSNMPSNSPSFNPTVSPTHFDGYYIGDFKFSFKSADHGFWKLCDGEFNAIDGIYQPLFDAIGYMFGKYVDSISNQSYFQLPNVTDSIMGIAGPNNLLGSSVGEESIILTSGDMPIHSHYVVQDGMGNSYCTECSMAMQFNPVALGGGATDTEYKMTAGAFSTGEANKYRTSTAGNSNPGAVSVMQPTAFYSNLFIYTSTRV
eukprot:195771_1